MPFYKYFRKEEHMQSFIDGYVRFASLAYYKHLEDESKTQVLGDPLEGSIFIDFSEDDLCRNVLSLNLQAINVLDGKQVDFKLSPESGLVGFSMNVMPKDYANNWIFCVSMQESEKFIKDGYTYYVEFDEISFNESFRMFFDSLEKELIKNRRPFRFGKINENLFVLHPGISRRVLHESWYWHEKIHYSDNRVNDLMRDPRFVKQEKFANEYEYRYLVYMDLFKIKNIKNVQNEFDERMRLFSFEKENRLANDLECIQILKQGNTSATFHLEKFKIYKCGKVK